MSFHALTCDPDCPGSDCYCDCSCHLPPMSNLDGHAPTTMNTPEEGGT